MKAVWRFTAFFTSNTDFEIDNKGDEDVLEHKRGVICLPRVGDLAQNNFLHTDIDNIQEADDDSEAEVEAEPKCPNSEKIFSSNKNCALNMKFFVHSNNGQKHKSKKLSTSIIDSLFFLRLMGV